MVGINAIARAVDKWQTTTRARRHHAWVLPLLACFCACMHGVSASAEKQIPTEVAEIVKRNRKSLRRLRQCKALLDYSFLDTSEEVRVFYERGYKVFVKGRKVREDYLVKPGPDGRPPQYAIPLHDGRGGKEVGPSLARRYVLTPEARILYRPGEGAASVRAGYPNSPYVREPSVLYWPAMLYLGPHGYKTLEDSVALFAESHGVLPSLSKEKRAEESVYVLQWLHPKYPKATLRVWIVPAKGYLVRKVQETVRSGKLHREQVVTLKEYAEGLFWFEKASRREWWTQGTRAGQLYQEETVVLRDLELHTEVPDSVFTLDGLGVPPGAEIHDDTLGVRTRYDKPFELPEHFVQSVLGDDRPERASRGTESEAPATKPTPPVEAERVKPGQQPKQAAKETPWPPLWRLLAGGLAVLILCTAVGLLLVSRSKRIGGSNGGKAR